MYHSMEHAQNVKCMVIVKNIVLNLERDLMVHAIYVIGRGIQHTSVQTTKEREKEKGEGVCRR